MIDYKVTYICKIVFSFYLMPVKRVYDWQTEDENISHDAEKIKHTYQSNKTQKWKLQLQLPQSYDS